MSFVNTPAMTLNSELSDDIVAENMAASISPIAPTGTR